MRKRGLIEKKKTKENKVLRIISLEKETQKVLKKRIGIKDKVTEDDNREAGRAASL